MGDLVAVATFERRDGDEVRTRIHLIYSAKYLQYLCATISLLQVGTAADSI
jgi:hypothetical protein